MWNAPSSDDYYNQFVYGEPEEEQEPEVEDEYDLDQIEAELEAATTSEVELAEREADMARFYAEQEEADFAAWVAALEDDAAMEAVL